MPQTGSTIPLVRVASTDFDQTGLGYSVALVTSSQALRVTGNVTVAGGAGGSTSVNVVGSTGTTAVVTSSGSLAVQAADTPDATTTATFTSGGGLQNVTLALNGKSELGVQLVSTGATGTVDFQVSYDGGTTFVATSLGFLDPLNGAKWNAAQVSRTFAVTTTTDWFVGAQPGGITHFRVETGSGLSAGSVAVRITATNVRSNLMDVAFGSYYDEASLSGPSTHIAHIRATKEILNTRLPSALASDRLKVDGSGVTQPVGFETPATAELTSASINFTTTGDNTVVAGVGGQTVRVFRIFFVVGAATNITIKDGAGTSLTGGMNMTANGAFVLDFDGEPWFVTSAGNAFIINQSGTAQVSGRVYHEQS